MLCEYCKKDFSSRGLNIHLIQHKSSNIKCYIYYIRKYQYEDNFPFKKNSTLNGGMRCECCNRFFKQLYRHLGQYSDSCYQYYMDKYKEEKYFPLGTLAKKFCPDCGKLLSDHRSLYCDDCQKTKYNVMKKNSVKRKCNKQRIKTCIQKYGVPNYLQTDEGKLKARKNRIKLIEQQKLNGEPLCPIIGNFERQCLDELEKLINIRIIRNKKVFGYYPDGLIDNIIIEYDEAQHFSNGKYIDKDIYRQKYLEERGFIFFRIKDVDWNRNKKEIISKFLLLLSETYKDQSDGIKV